MEILWSEKNFIEAKITEEEADLFLKIIGYLKLSDLTKMGLSEKERFLLNYIYYELG